MSIYKNLLRIFGLALTVLAVSSCAPKQNTIELLYKPTLKDSGQCKNTFVVVELDDNRQIKEIGDWKSELYFYPSYQKVSTWISRALYSELSQAGCTTYYYDRLPEFSDGYVITGDIQKLYLKQPSATTYKVEIIITIRINYNDEQIFLKTYTLEQENKTFPIGISREEIIMNALQELMVQIVPEIIK